MVIVHVQHFLNEKGQQYFKEWIAEIAQTLRSFKGFHSISILENIDQNNECHLLLTFESEILLRKWANSKEHDNFIQKLKPYQHRKQVSSIFKRTKVFES